MRNRFRLTVSLLLVACRLVAGAGLVLILCESPTAAGATTAHEQNCTCALGNAGVCPVHGGGSSHTDEHHHETTDGTTPNSHTSDDSQWCSGSSHNVQAIVMMSTIGAPAQSVFEIAPPALVSSKSLNRMLAPAPVALPLPLRPPRA